MGRREEDQTGETFPAAPKDAALAVRSSSRPPYGKSAVGPVRTSGGRAPPFSGPAVACFGGPEGTQVAGEKRTDIRRAGRGWWGSRRRN